MASANSAKKHPLARWRNLYGLTQSQLADKAGVDLSTIARIETGSVPKIDTALKIAGAFSISDGAFGFPAELIWGDQDKVEGLLTLREQTKRGDMTGWDETKHMLLDAGKALVKAAEAVETRTSAGR